ncbi:MAG: helix-hairpin-helix domain-containing protein [Roseburia sp.]|nr:helix-hairpin-helix domain-containing protein [Roseburia sp.]
MKKKRKIGCVLGIFLLCFCACNQDSDIYLEEYEENVTDTGTEAVFDTQIEEADEENAVCYVYVCGAVQTPGVYALPEGSRIYEAISQAGGLTVDADGTCVNQAEQISDGMMIRIYTQAETSEAEAYEIDESQPDDGRVDINSAGIAELMTLPGIGASKAEAILSYREENGDFSKIEDLMNIPGIKEGIFNQIKEHIKVNN